MLTGSYKHPLDEKGRCVVPKALRSELGEAAYLTRGADGCIWIFPEDAWHEFVKEIERRAVLDREGVMLSRYFLGTAARVTFDRLGRIAIPAMLREWAELRGEVVFAGVGSRVEIWSPERWAAAMAQISEETIREMGL